ncbi:MAG: arsenical-resistance protein [Deltaproteobacteria bacterium]|nr:MAG: arsenical-resistance protein [Deltaproteobacteria bacterium]
MGIFERYLSVWVAAAIAAGVALGLAAPDVFAAVADLTWAHVNLPVAVLIWAMIYPMMLKVDPGCLVDVGRKPAGIALTLVVNWLVKPFTMAALGVAFFQGIFAGLVAESAADQIVAGMILLGVAPCTAMVFVWSHLTRGDPNYTLVQVSVNDIVLVFAFAPIAGFLLGVTGLEVPWETLVASVVVFVGVPLAAGVLTRNRLLRRGGPDDVERFAARFGPVSMVGLIATVVLVFGFQARTIVDEPLLVALIAVPLLVQSYGIFALAYGAARLLRLPFEVAAPAALIGTSNFFELAIAVAISLFGLGSPAALATVVGVLIEVPVMLTLVALANRTRHWFAADARST